MNRSNIHALVWVLMVALLGNGCRSHWNEDRRARYLDITLPAAGEPLAGEWSYLGDLEDLRQKNRRVWHSIGLRFDREQHHVVYGLNPKDLDWGSSQVEAEGPGAPLLQFRHHSPDGEWHFEGNQTARGAEGQYTFSKNQAFAEAVTALCGAEPDASQWLTLALTQTPEELPKQLQAAGFRITVAELIRLRQHGISADYAVSMRRSFPDIKVDELTRLRSHGVNPDYVQDILKAGPYRPEDLIRFRQHGVTPEYVAALRQSLPEIKVEEIVRMRQHGVPTDYSAAFQKAGYHHYAPEDLIRLRQHGITADYAADFKQAQIDLSREELIRLRQHGVDAAYAAQIRATGLGAKPEDYVRLRNHGFPAAFAQAAQDAGYRFSADQLLRLRNHGVSTDYLKGLKAAGYQCSADDIIKLRQYGVSLDYLKTIQESGRANLPVDTIVELRQRGLSADSVRKIRQQ